MEADKSEAHRTQTDELRGIDQLVIKSSDRDDLVFIIQLNIKLLMMMIISFIMMMIGR